MGVLEEEVNFEVIGTYLFTTAMSLDAGRSLPVPELPRVLSETIGEEHLGCEKGSFKFLRSSFSIARVRGVFRGRIPRSCGCEN